MKKYEINANIVEKNFKKLKSIDYINKECNPNNLMPYTLGHKMSKSQDLNRKYIH
jgi:hypothetical protein